MGEIAERCAFLFMRRNGRLPILAGRRVDDGSGEKLLCEECREEVDATYETRHHVEDVRGVTVEVDIGHLICQNAGPLSDGLPWSIKGSKSLTALIAIK
jgi:hypothetical protein